MEKKSNKKTERAEPNYLEVWSLTALCDIKKGNVVIMLWICVDMIHDGKGCKCYHIKCTSTVKYQYIVPKFQWDNHHSRVCLVALLSRFVDMIQSLKFNDSSDLCTKFREFFS